jgi:hypothetical protein
MSVPAPVFGIALELGCDGRGQEQAAGDEREPGPNRNVHQAFLDKVERPAIADGAPYTFEGLHPSFKVQERYAELDPLEFNVPLDR